MTEPTPPTPDDQPENETPPVSDARTEEELMVALLEALNACS